MPSVKLIETRKEFEAKQKKLDDIFKEAKTEGKEIDLAKVTSLKGTTEEKTAEIRKMNEELNELGVKIENLVILEKAESDFQNRQRVINQYGESFPFPEGKSKKSLGELFIEAKAHTEKHSAKTLDIQTKTLFERTAGWSPESVRSGMLVDYATRPIQVVNVIPQGTINQDVYKYMEETTRTDNAAEVAEGDQYAENAYVLTERSQTVEKIAAFLPVTDEQLEDVSGAMSYVDQRLVASIGLRLDSQLLQGNGVSPNIIGIYNKPGIQTQAKGADPTPDAVYKAMTKVMVTGQGNPNIVIMHPNDWQEIRLLRTADGIYIWGNPSEPGIDRIWGLPVIKAQVATEGTGIVADTTYCMFFTKKGVTVKVSDSHSDYFIKGKQAIRAEMRGAMVIFRAAAFCTVTGI